MILTHSKDKKTYQFSIEDRETLQGTLALLRLLRNADMANVYEGLSYLDYDNCLSTLKLILKLENENMVTHG